MRTRTIAGVLQVGVVGLGCNNFGGRIDEAASRAVIDAALDAGITLFDTADVYGGGGGSEEIIGRALGGRRDRVVLATKFGWNRAEGGVARGSRAHVREAVEASLRRLQTDRIDLLQYHRPDGVTPVEETLGALDELVREGKVRAIGSSNFTAAQVAEAHAAASEQRLTPFATEQSEYSLLAARTSRPSSCRPAGGSGSASFPTSPSPPACSPARSAATGRPRRGLACTDASSTRPTSSGSSG